MLRRGMEAVGSMRKFIRFDEEQFREVFYAGARNGRHQLVCVWHRDERGHCFGVETGWITHRPALIHCLCQACLMMEVPMCICFDRVPGLGGSALVSRVLATSLYQIRPQ
jgi:hypothetical protein